MTPTDKLHIHHEKLIGTIRDLAERTKSDSAEASLLITFSSEYLLAHAEAEEVTLYKADSDTEFVDNMVHEHRKIKEALEAISTAYSKGDSAGIVSEMNSFMALLETHFEEEENTLMPKLSKMIAQQELESLIVEAHQIESEKKRSDIWSLFEHDHKRIDFNISPLRKSSAGSDAAGTIYSKVRGQLLKHIELEESVLFPSFVQHASPGQTGPVQVMIAEHREITALLIAAGDSKDAASLGSTVDALVGKLATHNKKEELILYPLIDRTLPAAERQMIFKECFDGFASV